MTLVTTSNSITYQGDGSNTNFAFAFIIPEATQAIVTLTTIATGATQVLSSSVYSITGLDNESGGSVTYPLSGSPLSSAFNLSIQRIVPLTQETDLVNQSGFYPDVVEAEFDYLTMITQQLQEQLDRALAFPIGASSVDVDDLITDILNGAANATAAAASAAAAAASAATILGVLPLAAANIATNAVTSIKINTHAVTPIKLDTASIPQGAIMLNGTILENHAASAATFAVKTFAGDDPSSTDPVYVLFRDPTVANGDYIVRTLTAALSLVISSGSTLGATSATAFRLWLVLFDDGGTVRLGIINCLSGTNIYSLGQNPVASSIAEGGVGAADSAQVFYTGTAVTLKSYVIIGHATYETGLTTAGTWGTSPTRLRLNALGMPLPGSIIQHQSNFTGAVATGTTAIPLDDTIPQITEGDQYMTQAITPSSAANLLSVSAQVHLTNSASAQLIAALFQDATASALVAVNHRAFGTGDISQMNIKRLQLAALTVATTFRVRGGAASGTTTFNGSSAARLLGGVMNSYMEASEIMT